jgi:DNA polymerase (family 10)
VTSDAHSTEALGFVELGIGQARRAWLSAAQVLNTRPWNELQGG